MLPVVLVHGGLHDDMTPDEFWGDSGILEALENQELDVFAPRRAHRPSSWHDEAQTLANAILARDFGPVAIVAGSNGCSAAVRLAIEHPSMVERLMLCWPATAGDAVVDELARVIITDETSAEAARALLDGDTLRGVSDAELAALTMPCVVFPSLPENKIHQRRTVTALLGALPDPILLGGSPEPVDDGFAPFLDTFVRIVTEFARVEDDD